MSFNNESFFLAGEKADLILTRFVPNVPGQIQVKKEEPLRILVVISHPKELPDIATGVTRDVIKDIEELENLKHIEVRVEKNPTHDQLYSLMNGADVPADAAKKPGERVRFKPDIFHFIGHGEPGKLALIRNEEDVQADFDEGKRRREADWRNSKDVLSLFANHMPRLVFLHACDLAKPESVDGLKDLARDLVYANVPVVIAMQYTIRNKDAALFARTFYAEIRKGSQIDEAVRAGREALGAIGGKKPWSDRNFGTPVVYFQDRSQEALMEVDQDSGQSPRSTKGGYDPYRKVPCPNPKCDDGKVMLGASVCIICDHEVMLCPECQSRSQYNLMDKTIGRCGMCGHSLIQARPATFGPGVASERKEEAQSVAAPQPPGTYSPPLATPPSQFEQGLAAETGRK
jgi:hypothetical protein